MKKEKLMGRSPLDTAFGSASTQEKRSKKGIAYVALLGVAGLASASSVFAANVSINSDAAINYSQGTTTIAACDEDIDVELGAAFDGDSFALDTIELSDVDAGCDGQTLVLSLYKDTGTILLVTITETVSQTGGVHTIGIEDDPLAAGATVAYEGSFTAEDLAAAADAIVIEIND
jgi:hypothetical protein